MVEFPNKVTKLDYGALATWIKNEQAKRLEDLFYHELEGSGDDLPCFLLLVQSHGLRAELYEGVLGTICQKLDIKCRVLLSGYRNYKKILSTLGIPSQ